MHFTHDPHGWEDSYDLEGSDPEEDFCEDCNQSRDAGRGRYCKPCDEYLRKAAA